MLPKPEAFYNGIAHSIFHFDGTIPVTTEKREELRAEYRILLDRAKEIKAHTNGWVCMIFFATPEDAKRASAIEAQLFLHSS